jgi:hypothetical protein
MRGDKISMVFSIRDILGFTAGVLLASAMAAEANTIVISETPFTFDYGGETSAATTDDFVANYAPVATMAGQFETFCVESGIFVGPGASYSYTLSAQDSTGRALSEGAAFLYYEFATGQLAGYDYADPAVGLSSSRKVQLVPAQRTRASQSVNRVMDAGELQAAIWAFQDNTFLPGFPSLATDPFYQLAIDDLGATAADGPNNGLYNVDIIQLWDGSTPAQNQLVYLGMIPDAASTRGLLTAACCGLVFLVRRLNGQHLTRCS